MIINEYKKVDCCCICFSKDLDKILDMGRTSLANNLANNCTESLSKKDYELCLVKCKECNHVQLNTEIDKELLFSKYSYKSGVSETMYTHFTEFSNDLCKYFDKKSKPYSDIKVLDIGSNDSTLLDILSSKGYKTFGIEPASNLARISKHKIFNCFFEDKYIDEIYKQFGSFDVITANNVFAHTRDLNKFLKNMRHLLREDGIISIEVQYLPNLIKNCYIDMIYHEHTSYHHLRPLMKLFEKYDLKLNSVSNIATHGGSMRIILNNYSKNKIKFMNQNNSIDFINIDNNFDSEIINKFEILKSKVKEIRLSLNRSITQLTRKYPLLYGYSAPAKTVTLLSLLDEENINKIEFIIEDNNLKQGHYIPRTKIQLISSDKAIERINNQKSACIIFAWNMFEELSKKLKSNSKLNPNVIITPLPYPRIIEIS